MNVVHVTVGGSRTTASIPPYLAALLWGAGVDSLDDWAQARLDESPDLWAWSAQWSDTLSGRLVACALREVARPEVVDYAGRHVVAA